MIFDKTSQNNKTYPIFSGDILAIKEGSEIRHYLVVIHPQGTLGQYFLVDIGGDSTKYIMCGGASVDVINHENVIVNRYAHAQSVISTNGGCK